MLVTGVDIVEIHRVDRVVGLYGKRFLNRIYTGRELAYARGRAPQLASRFAAKEAVMKALGTELREEKRELKADKREQKQSKREVQNQKKRADRSASGFHKE